MQPEQGVCLLRHLAGPCTEPRSRGIPDKSPLCPQAPPPCSHWPQRPTMSPTPHGPAHPDHLASTRPQPTSLSLPSSPSQSVPSTAPRPPQVSWGHRTGFLVWLPTDEASLHVLKGPDCLASPRPHPDWLSPGQETLPTAAEARSLGEQSPLDSRAQAWCQRGPGRMVVARLAGITWVGQNVLRAGTGAGCLLSGLGLGTPAWWPHCCPVLVVAQLHWPGGEAAGGALVPGWESTPHFLGVGWAWEATHTSPGWPDLRPATQAGHRPPVRAHGFTQAPCGILPLGLLYHD